MPSNLTTLMIGSLTSTGLYADKFVVELYSDSGYTTKLDSASSAAIKNASGYWYQRDPIVFRNIVLGTTYYLRGGVVAPTSGKTTWTNFTKVVGALPGAPACTYSGTYGASPSGIGYNVTAATIPSDFHHYEAIWLKDGSTPTNQAAVSLWSGRSAVISIFHFNVPGQPGDVCKVYVRAVNTAGARQNWILIDTRTIPTAGESIGTLDNIGDGATYKRMSAASTTYRPTSNALTAADVSGAPLVTVAAFTMRAAGVGDISVNGGTVSATNADYSKTAFIYYDDPTFAGGTPATGFHITFTREIALSDKGRFFVGSVPLPKAGGSMTVGNNDGGAGAQYTKDTKLLPASYTASGWNNPQFGISDDQSSFSDATTTSAPLTYEASAFPQFSSWFTKNTLKVKHQLTAITGGAAYLQYSLDDGLSWPTLRTITTADTNPVTTSQDLVLSQRTDKVRVRLQIPGSSTGVPGSAALNAGTAADNSGVGTVSWANPTNAQGAANGTLSNNTTALGVFNASSHYLLLTNFGFSIPSNATIDGISCVLKCYATYDDGSFDPDMAHESDETHIKIVKGGSVQSTNKADNMAWPSVLTNKSYGSSTDKWGTTWTYSDINASNFGLAVAVDHFRGPSVVFAQAAYVDSCTITVYYTTPGSSTTSSAKVFYTAQEVSF